jgi:hypothetical protein
MSPDHLKLWKGKAAQAKLDHAQKYPGYQYTPRKAADTKRKLVDTNSLDMLVTDETNMADLGSKSFTQVENEVLERMPQNGVECIASHATELQAVISEPGHSDSANGLHMSAAFPSLASNIPMMPVRFFSQSKNLQPYCNIMLIRFI